MLRLQDVCVRYGERQVLSGLQLHIDPGQVYGLLGPNGSGKTTTMRLIAGLLAPDAGTVTIAGAAPGAESRYLLGVVPQEICLYDRLSCAENLGFVASLYGLHGVQRSDAVAACLLRFGLSDRAGHLARVLSGGQQRRLHVALGLIHRPRLLILDEPTVGLDIESRQMLWGVIDALRGEGMAILLTTHLVDEVERLCNRIGILSGGRLVAEGTLDELRGRVPAVQVVTVRTQNEQALRARLAQLDLHSRAAAGGVNVWFPARRELAEVLRLFEGLPIDGLSQRPVSIEDVYLEVLRPQGEARPAD